MSVIRIASPELIGPWMELVRAVHDTFPGLETEESLREHRDTVLRFMSQGRALCTEDSGRITGVLLFSIRHNQICFLAVDPAYRRRGLAGSLLDAALGRLDPVRPVTVSTFLEDDPRSPAPRAFYRRHGFREAELTEEFGCPNQVFRLDAPWKAKEFFDIVDDSGEPTGQIVERSFAHAHGIPHRTSHVWIVREKEGRPQILLQMRCKTKDSYPGCYDISSAGHIPAGFGFAESALRELKEELGITVSESDLIPCGDRVNTSESVFYGRPFINREYTRVFLLRLDFDEDVFAPQPEEIDYVKWFDTEDALRAVRERTIPHCIHTDELEKVIRAYIG